MANQWEVLHHVVADYRERVGSEAQTVVDDVLEIIKEFHYLEQKYAERTHVLDFDIAAQTVYNIISDAYVTALSDPLAGSSEENPNDDPQRP